MEYLYLCLFLPSLSRPRRHYAAQKGSEGWKREEICQDGRRQGEFPHEWMETGCRRTNQAHLDVWHEKCECQQSPTITSTLYSHYASTCEILMFLCRKKVVLHRNRSNKSKPSKRATNRQTRSGKMPRKNNVRRTREPLKRHGRRRPTYSSLSKRKRCHLE